MLAFMTHPDSGGVAQYCARLRAEGFQPVQFWVPDTRSNPVFVEKVRQQCLALKVDPAEAEILALTEVAAGMVEGWE